MRFALSVATVLSMLLACAVPNQSGKRSFYAGTVQAKKPVVAVFEIQSNAKVSNEDLQTLHRLIGTKLTETRQFEVAVNSEIKRALQEKKAESYKDCYDESCQIEIGKAVAAAMILSTSISPLGGKKNTDPNCNINMQLYDLKTETSRIAANEISTCQPIELRKALIRGIEKLAGNSGLNRPRTTKKRDKDVGETPDEYNPKLTSEVIVKFSSEPPGAVVLVDDKMLCQNTPCQKKLTPGDHKIRIEKEKYFAYEERKRLGKDSRVDWKLKPKFATIDVSSSPSGLLVKIDKRRVGKTPLKNKELSPGRHTVMIEDKCFHRKGKEINIDAGESQKIDLEMQSREGMLSVDATDEADNSIAADIRVDDKDRGRTPAKLKVSVCAKRLILRAQGFRVHEQSLKIPYRESYSVEAQLERLSEQPARALPRWAWYALAASSVATGLFFDLGVESARNRKLDTLDFLPLGLYVSGITFGFLGAAEE